MTTNDNKPELILTDGYVSLKTNAKDKPIYIDFLEGALHLRQKHSSRKKELIAKAVGIKPRETVKVLDATAGLGRDAFILACLGCNVTLCERSAVMQALLQDGIQRAMQDDWFRSLSFTLIPMDALTYFSTLNNDTRPDVIYIDPMFPEKNKSALVKKEMRMLREVVGDDTDAEELLSQALKIAKKRVVVKRAKLAPVLGDHKPTVVYRGKSSRFDVYLLSSGNP